MFTGIVQAKVTIAWVLHTPLLTRYALFFTKPLLENLVIGASISVQGICQTVVAIQNNLVTFEAIAETLTCTNLSTWKEGHQVNIERSLKMGDEVGGHLVSGHIVGTGEITQIEHPSDEQSILTIRCDPKWMNYLLPKGYVAVDGASLTVGKTDQNGFTVNLIPETRRLTTLGEARVGDKVNIEIDSQTQAIVDTITRLLPHSLSSGGASSGL